MVPTRIHTLSLRWHPKDIDKEDPPLSLLLPHANPWHGHLSRVPESNDDLLTAAAAAWWEREVDRLAERWKAALGNLAALLERDAKTVSDAGLASALRARVARVRFEATTLDSSADLVGVIDRLETSAPLVGREQDGSFLSAPLETPFRVVGALTDCGLAWRGEKADYAWYVEPSDLTACRKNRGRFLIRGKSFLEGMLGSGIDSTALANLGLASFTATAPGPKIISALPIAGLLATQPSEGDTPAD